MYKTKKITSTYESETISEVTCDYCGKNIDINNAEGNGKEKYTNVNLYLQNTHIPESPEKLQLCNDCVRILYLSMKYKCENDEYYEDNVNYYFDKHEDFDNEL